MRVAITEWVAQWAEHHWGSSYVYSLLLVDLRAGLDGLEGPFGANILLPCGCKSIAEKQLQQKGNNAHFILGGLRTIASAWVLRDMYVNNEQVRTTDTVMK